MSRPVVQDAAEKLLLEALGISEAPRQSNEWNRLVIAAADASINRRKNRFSAAEREKLTNEFAAYLSHESHSHGVVHSHSLEMHKPGKLQDASAFHGPAEVMADQFISSVDKSLRFSKALSGAHLE
jgi:hypothetical protein